MNCKEFYANKRSKVPSNFKKMFDAGYFGNASFDPTKRIYDIHPDTPLPYTYELMTEGVVKLSLELLKAANKTCSVFPRMFPRIHPQAVTYYIDLFIENGYIHTEDTPSGVRSLILTPQGEAYWNGLKGLPNKRRLENINLLLNTFAEPAGRLIGEAVGTAIAASNKAS